MKNNYIFLLSMAIVALLATGLAHAAGSGGGSSSPSITVYSNGSQIGYQLANLTVGNSETLNFSNNTKTEHVTINFINPTNAGITANNQTYNLTIGNATVLTDSNSYTGYAYYAELKSISYLNITLLVYGQPPIQPNAVVTNTTTIVATKNVTEQRQPTTVPPTQRAPASTTMLVSLLSSPVPLAANGYLIAAIILVIVLLLILVYYNNSKNKGRARSR